MTLSVNDRVPVVDVHDADFGNFAVPVTTADGRRHLLYSRFDGEFDTYKGERPR